MVHVQPSRSDRPRAAHTPDASEPPRSRHDSDQPPKPDLARRVWWTPRECGRAWGLSTRDVRRRLHACKALRRRHDGRYELTLPRLKRAFPEDWVELYARLQALK